MSVLEGVSFTLQRSPFAGIRQLLNSMQPMVNCQFTEDGVSVEVEPNSQGGSSAELTRRLESRLQGIELSETTAYLELARIYLEVTHKSPHATVHIQVYEAITFEQIGAGWRIVNNGSSYWAGLAERMRSSDLCVEVNTNTIHFDPGDSRESIYFEVEARGAEDPIPQLVALKPVILG